METAKAHSKRNRRISLNEDEERVMAVGWSPDEAAQEQTRQDTKSTELAREFRESFV